MLGRRSRSWSVVAGPVAPPRGGLRSSGWLRLAAVAAAAAALAVVGSGLAASNTFAGGNARKAGDGSGAVTGYALVGNPVYTLDANDPRIIANVQFQLNAAATSVRAALNATSPTAPCTAAGPPNTWNCALNVTAATGNLYITAAQ